MNHIICKYVNSTNVLYNSSKITISQIRSKALFSQTTTELRHTLDDVAKELNFTQLNDWYKMPIKVRSTPTVIKPKEYPKLFQGDRFEKEFNASPTQLLSHAYPEHEWLPWKFEKCPNGFWNDVDNQRAFLTWAAKQLNVKDISDWYNVTYKVNIKTKNRSRMTI